MSTLNIKMKSSTHLPQWSEIPVPVEVLDTDLQIVHREVIRGQESVNVEPGSYLVRARLPSGETVSGRASLEEPAAAKEVLLSPRESPHEWLGWQQVLGNIPARKAEKGLSRFPSTWLRLWVFDQGEWTTVDTQEWHRWARREEDLAVIGIDVSEHPLRLRMIQVGGEAVPWRLISFPPTPKEVQILLRPTRTPTSLDGGLAAKVVSTDMQTESLSYYLRSGALESASAVSRVVMEEAEELEFLGTGAPPEAKEAEELLRGKLRNPFGAAVGGYYLLQIRDFERMHNWPNNFANWLPWLPDGAVIHAWQLLLTAGIEYRSNARERLLQAWSRGLPVYSQGLRLLIDGLELFENSRRRENVDDKAVENALEEIRVYAEAVDWNQRLTTFYGPDPKSPSLTSIMGTPQGEAPGHFQFVTNMD